METSVNNKCRAFTSLEQSRKLSEILPLESADMKYPYFGNAEWGETPRFGEPLEYSGNKDKPCWSLASLLCVLPILDNRSPTLSKTFDGEYRVLYHSTSYEMAILTSDYDNPVDACVELILKLNELNLL